MFRTRLTIELLQGLKVFLNLNAGFARGSVPDPERTLAEVVQQRDELRTRLQNTRRRLARKDRQLKQARRVPQRGKRRTGKRDQKVRGKAGFPGGASKREARRYLLDKLPERSVCAEIGVDEGKFSRLILDTTSPERLHLIDPYKHEQGEEYEGSRYGGLGSGGQAAMDQRYEMVREQLAVEIRSGQVQMHRGSSNQVSDDFGNSYFDWIYIDGNHLYKFVRQDLSLYYPKVKPGGYIVGDDYGVDGWWENGVQEAVDEFVSGRPDLTLEVRGSQFIIKKEEPIPPVDDHPVDRSREAQADRKPTNGAEERLPDSSKEVRRGKWTVSESEAGVLPDYLIIGTQKGGTTYLYHLLSKHAFVEPAAEKEVHYFDSRRFKRGTDWYRSNFPPPNRKDGRRIITGESSPYYMYHPRAAQRAAMIVPKAKLVALLRNPVDRAYSDYQQRLRLANETLGFEEAIDAEEERLQGEKERLLADVDYPGRSHRRHSYLARGVYVDQLAEWHKYFDREQLLVLKSEDFFERPHDVLTEVMEFLDLPVQDVGLSAEVNEGGYENTMSPGMRRRLEDYFEPHNRRLYDYLGRDLGW